MARRTIEIDGERWQVYPSGRVTPYERDEFGLVFEKGTGANRIRRISRYSPLGARRWDVALRQLADARLLDLFAESQSAATSPEVEYGATA
ncbi:MAG: hypothetical protein IH616_15530 [Gemmatimonadales bacterium]|jgi:hypothetical protein|nr:hypothetical protein [Gemmatimonadales bacterium]